MFARQHACMMDSSPRSGDAATAPLAISKQDGGAVEPLDCTTPALDLCIRRKSSRSPSPMPEGARQAQSPSSSYPDHCSSPGSPSSHPYPLLLGVDTTTTMMAMATTRAKPKRPFKAYMKDPMSLALSVGSSETLVGKESTEAYTEFRRRMLSQMYTSHPPGVTNAKMRRSSVSSNAQDISDKDAAYWEKRRKNNEAAKRSRDARKAKEDEIAIRAAFLEQENLKLKYEIAALRNETAKLRCLFYN